MHTGPPHVSSFLHQKEKTEEDNRNEFHRCLHCITLRGRMTMVALTRPPPARAGRPRFFLSRGPLHLPSFFPNRPGLPMTAYPAAAPRTSRVVSHPAHCACMQTRSRDCGVKKVRARAGKCGVRLGRAFVRLREPAFPLNPPSPAPSSPKSEDTDGTTIHWLIR